MGSNVLRSLKVTTMPIALVVAAVSQCQSMLADERQWQLIVSFDPSEMPVVMALEMAVTLMAAFEGSWTRRWFAESD